MQINRLFKITYILMERESVTAGELAEMFEVSQRTIYRDIDKLAESGIPVYASRGKGGGISLMEGYVINKSVLTTREQEDIILGLENLKSLNLPGEEGDGVNEALAKLGSLFAGERRDWIRVDLGLWQNREKSDELFTLIKKGILESRLLRFTYFSGSGEETERSVEPIQIQVGRRFRYLLAYCLHRKDYRVFKLTRMENPRFTGETFKPRELPADRDPWAGDDIPLIDLVIRIHSSQAHRVYDEFPRKCIGRADKGDFTLRLKYPDEEWIYDLILSYGDKAEVISPNRIRREVRKRFRSAIKIYQ